MAPVIPSRFLNGDSAISLSTGDQVTPEIAIVSGKNNASGVALIEFYQLQ
ncbi:MAG: hypothetical protein M3Q86_07395 [Verrucomicrobiota bacterium]|nr:hypothetical protein [Verrucomicrobiota bacterium]